MIDLTKYSIYDLHTKSSKGDQFKWEVNGVWYKADKNGYESLSEYVVSTLLKYSSLADDEYVSYDLEQVKYKNRIFNACSSKGFLNKGDKIITLERLYKNTYGVSLTSKLAELDGYLDRANYLVNTIKSITSLNDFGSYLYKTLVIDALFLNEDRHLHNIAVMEKENGKYDYCPIFDNGAALLSDTNVDYPLNINVLDLLPNVKAKTIGDNFYDAIYEIENAYGTSISFSYTEKDIDEIVDKVTIYDESIKNRIKQLLKYQRNKMKYFF